MDNQKYIELLKKKTKEKYLLIPITLILGFILFIFIKNMSILFATAFFGFIEILMIIFEKRKIEESLLSNTLNVVSATCNSLKKKSIISNSYTYTFTYENKIFELTSASKSKFKVGCEYTMIFNTELRDINLSIQNMLLCVPVYNSEE